MGWPEEAYARATNPTQPEDPRDRAERELEQVRREKSTLIRRRLSKPL